MSIPVLRLISSVLLVAVFVIGTDSDAMDPERAVMVPAETVVREDVVISASLAAAIIAAYGNLTERTQGKDADQIALHNFLKRFGRVSCAKREGLFEITFGNVSPETTFGFGVTYIVDSETMEIRERIQGR